MQEFENWLEGLIGEQFVLVVEIFLIVFAALFLGYLVNKVIDRLEIQAAKTKTVWDDALIEAFRRPVVWFIWVSGINLAAIAAGVVLTVPVGEQLTAWGKLIQLANTTAMVFLPMLFLLNFIKRAEQNFLDPEYQSPPVDETTAKAVGKLLRAAVVISAALILMDQFDVNISGLLAFGGIGGIAVGFAAKDLLANFFGGMMIYFDRPFKVGDWVRSPDQEIEGTVEDIGWRMTRIRTFDKRPLYIPNSVFTQISIENPSRMTNRRIYETIGIRYDDIAAMDAIVADVKAMLLAHDEIDTRQTLIVNFNSFAASSVDFFVYTFTKTCNWVHFHEVKQDVLLKIAAIIDNHGAEIAFPTSTVHVPNGIATNPTEA
ncbi:mechanosensitive ion channel family protein [Porticoccus sp. W117]|uniref:mechanosensitive ion channel family protein n=1 Tax=Porticoccus sp. W117 TaxID=3054777 RepID=UPI002591E0FA|nr:mechanosensitive ion channel family protein [Porticoccus sp. W117]MDM3869944.1 mechanosensitive ion channel family protein [Porticoccus sp. W117]